MEGLGAGLCVSSERGGLARCELRLVWSVIGDEMGSGGVCQLLLIMIRLAASSARRERHRIFLHIMLIY